MGVDANILVFERTREELQKGKPLLQALQGGYQGAFSAIFDGNVASAITAALMIHFGTGPIRGFGTTLLAGLIIQMFTALFVTKAVFGLWIKKGWMTKMTFIDVFKVGHYPWMSKARPWQLGLARPRRDDVRHARRDGRLEVRPRLHRRHLGPYQARGAGDDVRSPGGHRRHQGPSTAIASTRSATSSCAPACRAREGDRSTEFDVKLRSEVEIDDAQVKEFMAGPPEPDVPGQA